MVRRLWKSHLETKRSNGDKGTFLHTPVFKDGAGKNAGLRINSRDFAKETTLKDSTKSIDVAFDYNPWIVVPLRGPSAALMKSGSTITTAIAFDRLCALYFPIAYYRISKRK
ncbi:unnamed protein product [Strongylus vulgaris]|uniref:Uncharacterized protein n=1 Tax=Strongylus vulgaris TaxID=40348 RepID=A0A3P7L985_STRVU|nr:unnamed protein product [Strongylus vulgaris]